MDIQKKVVSMYKQFPFPDYGDNPLDDTYVAEKHYIDLTLGFNSQGYSIYKDKTILDAGCGTGRESLYLALKGAEVTAIDITDKSLEVANKQARKHIFTHDIHFIKSSVLEMPFKDNHFDMVVSSGVIHHTLYPEKAFSELARVLKPNGYLILYVYNNWAHVIPNIRRNIVGFFVRDRIHKRVSMAKKLFPRYVKSKNLSSIYDEFSHPHKSEHSISEILSWFQKFNITYESVYPKLGFRGFHYTRKGRMSYINQGIFIPIDVKFNNPTMLSQWSSGLVQLLWGYRNYSGGYRFLGIKQEDNSRI